MSPGKQVMYVQRTAAYESNTLTMLLGQQWFKQLIDDIPDIQYRIELHIAGMKNNEHCNDLGISARLNGLKSQEQFWKNPESFRIL